MAIRIPIITDLEDKGIKQAKIAFGNFKTAVKDAEGGLGKFKAGANSIMDSVAQNAGVFAVAGGVAFAKFAASGITAFTDLALEAGKFADATGLSVEKASKYMEAAGDIGIPIDAVETAIGKMNKTIGADPDKVRNLGIDLVYLRDGSLDVNETFKNTIDRLKGIKDPAERARVAAQVLGKGWQSMAELIMGGSAKFEESLKKVSDQKVISPEELQMAREYRAAMDNLGDSVDDLKIKTGEKLVKPATFLANAASWVMSADQAFTDWAHNIFWSDDPVNGVSEDLATFSQNTRDAREDQKLFADMIRDKTNPQIDHLAQKLVNAKTATDNARAAWSNLIGQFERQVSFDKLDTDIDTLKEKAIAAFGGGKEEMDAFHEAQLIVAQDFEKMVQNFPPELSTKISIAINSGDLAQLAWAAGTVKFLQQPIGSGGNDPSIYRRIQNQSIPARAMGGPVMGGKSYLVGERGPELFTPGTSGGITPNSALGGNTITVNVNGGDPDAIVRAIQKYARQNGAIPLQTTTSARF